MLYAILFFIDIISILLIVVSIPIFFVREMRFAGTKILLSALGAYFGSGLPYLAIWMLWDRLVIELPESLVLTLAFIVVMAGLGLGVYSGYRLANVVNRQRGWD